MKNYHKAEFIKLCLFHYFKFRRHNKFISENFIGDNNIFTISKKGVQTQVKVIASKKELQEEFIKKNKMDTYEEKYRLSRAEFYYFCVPEDMVKDALIMIEGNEKLRGTGLISINMRFSRPKVINRFFNRVKFELVGWRNHKAKRYSEGEILHAASKEIFLMQKKVVEHITGMKFSEDGEKQYSKYRKKILKNNRQKSVK